MRLRLLLSIITWFAIAHGQEEALLSTDNGTVSSTVPMTTEYLSFTNTTVMSDSNGTSQQVTTVLVDSESVSTTQNSGSVTPKLTGMDFSDDGKAADLFTYFGDLFFGDDGGSAEKDQQAKTGKCNLTVGLEDVSKEIPSHVYAYFNNDVTIEGLINALFTPDIVTTLQGVCSRGSWCLPKFIHQSVLETSDRFYREGPFCSLNMLKSLNDLTDLRSDCDERALRFLVDAIQLLCTMDAKKGLTRECYARSLETLYVTYSDMIHPSGSLKEQLTNRDCNDFRIQMVNTYLCAHDVCPEIQQSLLENFNSWNGMTSVALGVVQVCNITRRCQDAPDIPRDETTTSMQGMMSTPLFDIKLNNVGDDDEEEDDMFYDDNYTNELEKIEEEIEEALEEEMEEALDNADKTYDGPPNDYPKENTGSVNDPNFSDISSGVESDEDRTVILGLISMTVVLVLGLMGVAFVGFKRYRRSRYSTLRRGYSQLTEEESKILRHEYN